jgi:hypothetical protein
MVKHEVPSNPLSDALAGVDLRSFVRAVREVADARHETLGALRSALEAGDDAASLRFARQLVGLPDEREGRRGA